MSAAAGHRERLIAAMAEVLAERGLRGTTVADVVARAHTSRRTFYEHFRDRDTCFLAVVAAVDADLRAAVEDSLDLAGDPDPATQVEQAVGAFLDHIAARPRLFRSLIHDLPALGEIGAAHGLAIVRQFAELLVALVASGRARRPELDPLTLDVATIIAGGLRELVVAAVGEGRDVRTLHEPAVTAVSALLLRPGGQAG